MQNKDIIGTLADIIGQNKGTNKTYGSAKKVLLSSTFKHNTVMIQVTENGSGLALGWSGTPHSKQSQPKLLLFLAIHFGCDVLPAEGRYSQLVKPGTGRKAEYRIQVVVTLLGQIPGTRYHTAGPDTRHQILPCWGDTRHQISQTRASYQKSYTRKKDLRCQSLETRNQKLQVYCTVLRCLGAD